MLKDNIALLRNFINISQRELGRRIGMTGQYIAKIEKGERMPTTETINKIIIALSENTLNRQFYTEELTSRPYTLIELIYKKIIEKKMKFHGLRHRYVFSKPTLEDILTGAVSPYTFSNIDILLQQVNIDPMHINKYIDLDNCILSSLTKEETTEYYSNLQKKFSSWVAESRSTFTTRLLNKIYAILHVTKSSDEIEKIFIDLTQCSHETAKKWVSLCSKLLFINFELDYPVQNSLLLYLHTLDPEECAILMQSYPFDIHPNVKRYYEQLTNTTSNTFGNCSTYILSEYLLSHNCDISKLTNEQLQDLDNEVKNFVHYQLYKLSHNSN